MKFAHLEKTKDFWFLIIISFVFFLFRLPSLFEPYWYGDEGIYQVIGMALKQGRLLYAEIWDNKPPLLYVLYALFSSDQFSLRLVSLIFGLFATVAFFFLAKLLFSTSKKIIFYTTSLFAILFAMPFLEGNIANAENFMLFPILLAALLVVRHLSSKNRWELLGAGFLLSIAFLFKTVAIFDLAAFLTFLFLVLYKGKKHLLSQLGDFSIFLGSFFLPILGVALFFIFSGIFTDFFNAAFFQMVGYVEYGNKFLIGQGLLFFKLILLSFFLGFLFLKRTVFSHASLFILSWLAFSLFNAFFAQRPYTHYLLVLLPSLVLFAGLIFYGGFFKEGTFKLAQAIKMQKVGLTVFLLLLFILGKNFHVYGKISSYYQNFILFMAGKKSVFSYRVFFDRNTPRDYAVAEFLKTHTKEKDQVFIWGNNAQVYTLVGKLPPGRYTVAYHAASSRASLLETQSDLEKKKPRFIVIMPKQGQIPYPLSSYSLRFIIEEISIYESIL